MLRLLYAPSILTLSILRPGCSVCKLFRVFGVLWPGCSVYRVFRVFYVLCPGCSVYRVFRVFRVPGALCAGCSECSMFRVLCVPGVECSVFCVPGVQACTVLCRSAALNSFAEVLKVYREAKAMLGEILSSCEFIDAESIECAKKNLQVRRPSLCPGGRGTHSS